MNAIWAITIILNVALTGILIFNHTWNRFPYFFGAMLMNATFTLMLLWAYYSPLVDQQSYTDMWILIDGCYVLINGLSAWDLTKGCRLNRMACILAVISYVQCAMTLANYFGDIASTLYPEWAKYINVALTLGLCVFAMMEGKENQ